MKRKGLQAWALLPCMLMVSIAAPANPPSAGCHRLFEQLAKHPLVRILRSTSFRRVYGSPEARPIALAIRDLKPIKVSEPFSIQADVSESGGTLSIDVAFVGSPPNVPRYAPPRPRSWNPFAYYLWALELSNPNSRHTRSAGYDPTLIKTVAALAEGIEARLEKNPELKRIRIHVPSVQNRHLEGILVKRFGFKIVRSGRYHEGIGGTSDYTGSGVTLTLDLDPR